ncbi:MAG: hypothetical protein LBL53_02405 [Endomicrobium sp.]|jgi:uncharacterized protein with PQ loop repeat|nr:hypothetical protein [Endomicrobium sp.]
MNFNKLFEILYCISGLLYIISKTPQIIQMKKTKQVRDINAIMLLLVIIADILGLICGFISCSKAMIAMNGIAALLTILMFIFKLLYSKKY